MTSNPASPSLSPLTTFATGNDIKFNNIYRSDVKNRSLYSGMSRVNSTYHSVTGTNSGSYNNLLDGRSGILLNKEREDLCWDHLFMVCGGTGITPMLQLVSSKISIYFIFLNLYIFILLNFYIYKYIFYIDTISYG